MKFLLNNISIFRDIVRARPNAGLYIANCPFHVSRYKWVLTISIWHVHEIIISLSFWFESYVWWRGITEFDMIYMVRCAVRKRIEECHKTDSTFKHTHWSVKAINWFKKLAQIRIWHDVIANILDKIDLQTILKHHRWRLGRHDGSLTAGGGNFNLFQFWHKVWLVAQLDNICTGHWLLVIYFILISTEQQNIA